MNKKQIAFNTHLILYFILFPVFLVLCISCALDKEVVSSIIFAVMSLLPVFVIMISPIYYTFTEESVEIIYNFGQKEDIKWSEIKSVTLAGNWIKGGGAPRYDISYPNEDNKKFFMISEISKTARTKKLISVYYKKKIL